MDLNSYENKPFQRPELHAYWAEYFPRVVRMGILGAVVVSAAIIAHEKFTNRNTDALLPHEPTAPDNSQT